MSLADALVAEIRAAVRAEVAPELRALRDEVAALRNGQGDRSLSPAEAAEGLGVSLCTIYRRIADKSLAHQRIGRRVVIPASALVPKTDEEIATLARQARG